ncbi:MAG: hypothetical protein QOJ11_2230 [Frankiales bacterium]|jgi:hypothetical protein|nr:hypothetical protein [Frankiales bacterium]
MALPVVFTALAVAVGLGPLTPAASPPTSGGWLWPLAGTPVVSRPFQAPRTLYGPGHRGVDLAARPDATVFAAGTGVVSFAGYIAGVGVVAVTHAGGLRTTYEPVVPSVHTGSRVAAGDPVGQLLSGHGDCGPGRWCLHWGLLRGLVYLDPLTLVRRGPVRLLPLEPAPVALPAVPAVLSSSRPAAEERPVSATGRSPVPGGFGPSGRRAVGAASAAGVAAVAGWWTRKRRMAAHRGRHRGISQRAALLSLAGRRAWP